MTKIKPYISYFKLRAICELQYRSAALAGMSTQIFFGFIYIMIYLAFYNNATTITVPKLPFVNLLAGDTTTISIKQMVTYLWLYQAFFYMLLIRNVDNDLMEMIKNGNVAYELCKPLNTYFLWFIKIMSRNIIGTLLRFFPIIIIGLLLPEPFNLSLPSSNINFILFIISLILALLISCITILFIHIITLFTLKEKGAVNLVLIIGELFTGGVIPTVLMPKTLQIISYLLPFRYIGDLPFRIYNGSIDITTSIINITMQLFWIIFLGIASYKLMNTALKKVVVQGG